MIFLDLVCAIIQLGVDSAFISYQLWRPLVTTICYNIQPNHIKYIFPSSILFFFHPDIFVLKAQTSFSALA